MFKTKLAWETWESKYRYGSETPLQTFERVARALASVEKNPEKWYHKFLHTSVRFNADDNPVGLKCTTGGRITANIGTSFSKATLINCYIGAPVSGATISYTRETESKKIQFPVRYATDKSPDDLINIFLTVAEQAKTLASEGGYGLSFDFIRPRGSIIKGTGVKHPGVVAYMKIWDSVAECIVQGDTDGYVDKIKNYLKDPEKFEEIKQVMKAMARKGAMLAELTVTHPDIEEFIRAKQTSGVLTKFNMSVGLTDDFMKAVENDDFFDQSFNGKVYKRIKARDLYDLIMQSCYNRAEPGVLFIDNMEKNNPIAYLGKCKACNPCVAPETLLLTDKGYFEISSLENQWVNIWNGFEYSNVLVRKTGKGRDLIKISFSNGKELECTFNHTFILKNKVLSILNNITERIEALKLGVGDVLADYELPIDFSGSITEKISGVTVTKIEYLGRLSDTYCFTENNRHTGIFNGIITGQCGEVPGLSTISTVCLLGSLNLTQYVKVNAATNPGFENIPYFDFDEYAEDIRVFTRMLDNVNDLTYTPLPTYQWVIENLRQIGMGINGLGSTLMMLGIPYGSEQSIDFVKNICEMKENLTWQTSALLAKEKGCFGVYRKEEFESTEYFNSDRITEETRDMLRKYGARNAKTTTVPPLGNSSLLCDVLSNGIEPVYLLEYERKVICREWPGELDTENVKSKLKSFKDKSGYEYWRGVYNGREYYYEPYNRGLCEVNTVRDYGYQWLLDNFPSKDHSYYLTTTKTLAIDDHLRVQAVVQHYNNQSTSKTCNLSNDYPYEDFQKLYLKAWKLGLNGFTTYREGSMESVLSEVSKTEKKQILARDIKLPDQFNNGPTQIIKREGKKFYLHFSYLPEDSEKQFPVVMWIYTNAKYKSDELRVCNKAARNLAQLASSCGISKDIVKEAVDKANQDYPHNRLGRIVSLCLRHNIPREEILVSLMGIDGDNISTLLTAVRKFLSKTLADGTALKGLKCPSCKSDRIVMDGGCVRCLDCPYSAC